MLAVTILTRRASCRAIKMITIWAMGAWICAGRVEDLPSPGSWLKVALGPGGVIVVRGEDGELRAFHAICPHRGVAMPLGERGCAPQIRCLHHGMTFRLDGRAHQDLPDLTPVRIAVEGGKVLVALGPKDD
jgi:phenylpropionate dioxygenase-like ring-hydroxylating dioxygenase large terminal subunit